MDSIPSGTAPSRTAHVLHLAPPEPARLARLALPALAAAAESGGLLRTLILVEDADAAVAVANHAALEIGGGMTPIIALTSGARARRVLSASMPSAAAMPIDVAAGLVARSALPADGIRQLILAMPGAADGKAASDALESVLSAIPKGATRTLVAAQETPQVEALVERYFFKARRTREVPLEAARPDNRPLRVMSTVPGARWDALRRLLDEIDPPSAAILTPDAGTHADAVRALAVLGYPPEGLVQAVRDDVPAGITLVAIMGVPDPEVLRTAFEANPVHLVVLCGPREIGDVRAVASRSVVTPWPLEGPRARAESRTAATRARLREILGSGSYAAELSVIGSLLEEYDGSEIAAAALVMVAEAGRAAPPPAAPVTPAAAPPPAARTEATTGHAPHRDRASEPDRGDRRPPRPRDDRRDERPPRSRDDRPRKFGDDRPRKFGGDDRPRKFGDDRPRKPADDRPRKFGDDRPRKPADDRARKFGDDRPRKPADDRPRKPADDRPRRPADDRPRKFSDRGRHK